MSQIKHSLLTFLANKIDRGVSALRWIDLYSAQYIADCQNAMSDEQLGGFPKDTANDIVALAVLVSFASSKGETFISLSELQSDVLVAYQFSNCAFDDWLVQLGKSSAVCVVTDDAVSDNAIAGEESLHFPLTNLAEAGLHAPLVLWRDRLYLARYWRLHQTLEHWLHDQTKFESVLSDGLLSSLSAELQSVFQDRHSAEEEVLNWQAISAAHTLVQNFSLITGGPGTGKTTTAASLLYLLMQKHLLLNINKSEASILSVRLLAPTGKAAIKLADSIRYQLRSLESRLSATDLKSVRMSDCLPETGETIHRFLYEHGALRESLNQQVQFSSEQVLLGQAQSRKAQVDIIVIDESSMIDLALMVELIKVIPENTKIIMLGDHYQLPAVEPGQVFAECVKRYASFTYSKHFSEQLSVLTGFDADRLQRESRMDSDKNQGESDYHPLCQLQKTYRFSGELKVAAEQIKQGQSQVFKKMFVQNNVQNSHEARERAVRWHSLSVLDSTANSMISAYHDYFETIKSNAPLSILVTAFEKYQLLCSTHEGPLGVIRLNELIEMTYIYHKAPKKRYGSGFYHGKAILVTRNHPYLGVFNGDIGFVMSGKENPNNWQIHFPQQNQTALIIAPGRLREWQPAYAMTVHKSQGSEYHHVGVVLADYAKELLSKALLYTALTRSKSQCDIWASSAALEQSFQ